MFYQRLELLCKKQGTTPTRLLVDKLNLSSSKVTLWKSGSCPKGDILIKIADYFGVSVDYLLDRDKTFSAAVTDEEILIESYRGCDEKHKSAILCYAIEQRQLCELHLNNKGKGGDCSKR